MDNKMIKVLGTVATVVGLGAALITNWVNEKELDEKIEDKINEAFAKRDKEDES